MEQLEHLLIVIEAVVGAYCPQKQLGVPWLYLEDEGARLHGALVLLRVAKPPLARCKCFDAQHLLC